MKKLLLLSVLAISLYGCSKEEPIVRCGEVFYTGKDYINGEDVYFIQVKPYVEHIYPDRLYYIGETYCRY